MYFFFRNGSAFKVQTAQLSASPDAVSTKMAQLPDERCLSGWLIGLACRPLSPLSCRPLASCQWTWVPSSTITHGGPATEDGVGGRRSIFTICHKTSHRHCLIMAVPRLLGRLRDSSTTTLVTFVSTHD